MQPLRIRLCERDCLLRVNIYTISPLFFRPTEKLPTLPEAGLVQGVAGGSEQPTKPRVGPPE